MLSLFNSTTIFGSEANICRSKRINATEDFAAAREHKLFHDTIRHPNTSNKRGDCRNDIIEFQFSYYAE